MPGYWGVLWIRQKALQPGLGKVYGARRRRVPMPSEAQQASTGKRETGNDGL